MSGILENSSSVQRWFIQLRKHSADGDIPHATRKAALESLRKFTEYAKMQPDELIALARDEMKRLGSIEKINNMLDDFWMVYPSKSSAALYFAMIKSFFKSNSILLTTKAPAYPFSQRKEMKLTTDIIRRICDVAPLHHASWMIANNYLGLRIEALTMLTVEDFHVENWTQNKPLYPVSISRQLSGTFDYTTFIGNDAKGKLASYFQGKSFPENHPWFGRTNYYIQIFKKYAFKAGVIDAPEGCWASGIPKGICNIRTHLFRKRVQTVLEGAGVPLNWVDHLLGHIPRGAQAKAYSRPSDEELYKTYLSALPNLEIYGHYSQIPQMQKQRILDALKLSGYNDEQIGKIQNIMGKVCPCFSECFGVTC